MAATLERFGRIDILVNNAATNPYMGPTLGISDGQFDKTGPGQPAGAVGVDP